MRIVFATHNEGKLIEMRALLADIPFEVMSAEETGVSETIEEDGTTFGENALKKARFVMQKTGVWAIADDSGLCICALGNTPGVMSRRWAGENVRDNELVRHTLFMMRNVPDEKRDAWFESAVALVAPNDREWVFQGKIEGKIAKASRGVPRPSLPYDTIFIPKGHRRTFGEMSDGEKNGIGHRGDAFRKLKAFLIDVRV